MMNNWYGYFFLQGKWLFKVHAFHVTASQITQPPIHLSTTGMGGKNTERYIKKLIWWEIGDVIDHLVTILSKNMM